VIPYQAGEWLTQLRNVIVTVGALQRLGIGPQATNGGIAQHSVGNLPQSAVTTSHTTNKLMGRGEICVNPLALAPVSRVLHFRHFLGRIGTARPLLKLDFGRGDRTALFSARICNEIRSLQAVFVVTCTLTNTRFSANFERLALIRYSQAVPPCSSPSQV
jgi:hypothetical protein